jgi:hypothetical protein
MNKKSTPLEVVTVATSIRNHVFRKCWLLVLVGVLVFTAWNEYWHENQPLALPVNVTHETLPASTLIQESAKGPERLVSENPPDSQDSRKRMDEISRDNALSPAEQKRNDDLKKRTAEATEPTRKEGHLPPSSN